MKKFDIYDASGNMIVDTFDTYDEAEERAEVLVEQGEIGYGYSIEERDSQE